MRNAISERWNAKRLVVEEAARWEVDDRWLSRVRAKLGTIQASDDDRLITTVRSSEQLRHEFLAHAAETRIHEVFRFTATELSALARGVPDEATVRSILNRWSLRIGEDGETSIDDVVLANPVLKRPFVAATEEDAWHLFCPWIPHHNPFALIEAVVAGTGLFDPYMERRAAFLEDRVATVFASALAGADVERSVLSRTPRTSGSTKTTCSCSSAHTRSLRKRRAAALARTPAGYGDGRCVIASMNFLFAHPNRQCGSRTRSVPGAVHSASHVRSTDRDSA